MTNVVATPQKQTAKRKRRSQIKSSTNETLSDILISQSQNDYLRELSQLWEDAS
jgi:hypothetical protein